MALYSNYPLDSTRYMLIDSGHRNRKLFPYQTDFDINLPNKSKENKDENNGLFATDPLYDGYPLEFGYFGSCSNDPTNFPLGLQLSSLSSASSNFYSRLIVQDETIFPRDYATIISYDATTQTTGYSKSAITSGWVKGLANTGNPGSLYSVRKTTPLVQGSCWVMPNASQVNLVNTGVISVIVNIPRTGLTSFQTDYNSDIDYTSVPVMVFPDNYGNNRMMPSYGPTIIGITNKNTGRMTNCLVSGYKNGNGVYWKPNTRFFVGNIIYTVTNGIVNYYTVIVTGITGVIEPVSTSLNTVVTDGGAQYVYKGSVYPLRKKWLPLTHYDLGDFIGIYCMTYIVTGTAGMGLSGDGESIIVYMEKTIQKTPVNGDLTLQIVPWFSTDPGFGYLYPFTTPKVLNNDTVLNGIPITGIWAPNTYMAEGTILQPIDKILNAYGFPYVFCVYKAGVSGSTPPVVTNNTYYYFGEFIKDGTAYLMVRGIDTSFYTYSYSVCFSGNLLPDFGEPVYAGKIYTISGSSYQFTCIQSGTMGDYAFLTYNDVDDTYTFDSGTAVYTLISYTVLGQDSADMSCIPTPRAPYTLNPKPYTIYQRYPVIPWSAGAVFNTGEYMYYGVLTFSVIQGGVSGDTPPGSVYKQTNGTVIISLVPYTDPYKGCLLKITQVEDDSNTVQPYYARISYYNPNTNIVQLDSVLPITEKRCLYEILQYSTDNYNPLEYTFSPFFSNVSSPMIFYDITLVSLTLPNMPVYSANNINVLTSGQAQPFDSYPKVGSFPFIIVTLKNTKNSTQAIPICSNNPSEYKSTFRVAVTDANPNLTSPFTRLYGNETVTMYLNPNDNLRLTITDPDGNLLVFANPLFFTEFIEFAKNNQVFPDTINYIGGNRPGFGLGWVMGDVLPIPPSPVAQVSVCFSIRPHV